MSTKDYFREFIFDGQRDTKQLELPFSASFPLALQVHNGTPLDLQEWTETISLLSKSGEIFDLIQGHGGAVLLRGLPIKTAQDYSEIAHAFRFRAHGEVGRPPHRTLLARNVKTANEGSTKAIEPRRQHV